VYRLTVSLVVLAVTGVGAQVPSHQPARPARAGSRVVARVNGVALTEARLKAALGALIPFESFHRNVSPARLAELRHQALDDIVDEELQYQEGIRLHARVPDAVVQKEVDALQQKFESRAAFDAALARSDATMADLRRELQRRLIAKEALQQEVTVKCTVSRADAEHFFRSNPDRFVVPEQLHLYAITVGVEPSASAADWDRARQRAEEVSGRLKTGASFQEMARTYSTDATRALGGDMGFLHRGALNDEFERATHNLTPGVASAVVQSLYGFHIVEIVEIRPPSRKSFAEVAADLQRDLTSKRCESMQAAWVKSLRGRATVILATAEL